MPNNIWKKIGLVTILAIIVIGGVFTLKSKKNENISNLSEVGLIKIAHFRETSALPFYVANENGYFKKQGLDVQLVEVDSKQLIDTLVTGKADFATAIAWPSVVGFEIEHPDILKLMGALGQSNTGETIDGILVREDSAISTLTDLKVKTIAFDNPRGIPSIKMVFKKIGFDPDKDVRMVEMGKDVIGGALQTGQIDAVWTTQPSLTIISNKIKTKLIEPNMRTRYITDPYWIGPIGLTTKNYLTQNNDTVKKLEAALNDAVIFIGLNPAEAKKLSTKYTPLTSDIAEQIGTFSYSKLSDKLDFEKMQSIVNSLADAQILKKSVDLLSMYVR